MKVKISLEETIQILQSGKQQSCIMAKERLQEKDNENAVDLVKMAFSLELATAALQRQIPTKPKEYEDKYYGCPTCGNVLLYKWKKYPDILMPKEKRLPYCLGCGQAIDWKGEKEEDGIEEDGVDDDERMESDDPLYLWTQMTLKNAKIQILGDENNGGNDEKRSRT